MMEFKPVPEFSNYGRSGKKSELGILIRVFHPFFLASFIFSIQNGWLPQWTSFIPQTLVILISILSFIGVVYAFWSYKLLSSTEPREVSGQRITSDCIEFFIFFMFAYYLYSVGWSVSFGFYICSLFLVFLANVTIFIRDYNHENS